jgi:hypothetical protein
VRVQVEGDAEAIESLSSELSALKAGVEKTDVSRDLTQQNFGFVDASAIITTVSGLLELATALKGFADHFFKRHKKEKPQILRLQSAVGPVVVELTPGTTLEQLLQTLSPLTTVD